MKACGIVAEYNPFHNGHVYQIQEAKKKTDADIIIVALSGNFLQRGEPSLLDKWTRARAALDTGADIIVEIPPEFSVQPADFFAKGAIQILEAMDCDYLSFGSESGNGKQFENAAELFSDKEDEIDIFFKSVQQQKLTYAKNMGEVITRLFPAFPIDLTQPNNVLGFSYAKEIRRLKSKMIIHTVPRLSSHYHDTNWNDQQTIASATAIRSKLLTAVEDISSIKKVVPAQTYKSVKESFLVKWDDFFPYLKYKITLSSLDHLKSIYLMEKGLEYRFKEIIKDSTDMNDFMPKIEMAITIYGIRLIE